MYRSIAFVFGAILSISPFSLVMAASNSASVSAELFWEMSYIG